MNTYLTRMSIPSDEKVFDSIYYRNDAPAWTKLNFHNENEHYPLGLFCNGLNFP